MRAFEVYLNNKRLCVAGIGGDSVLTAIISQVIKKGKKELRLHVGGLVSSTGEHWTWTNLGFKLGDEVRVTSVETERTNMPRKRIREDPKRDIEFKKSYVRNLAKELGWKIKAGPTNSN